MADVDVYHFALDNVQLFCAEAIRCLSPDERARAARFAFARDRDRFIAARAGLRRVLAAYCNTDPAELCLRYGLHGRPYLDLPGSGVDFNMSHSQAVAALAVSRDSAVGIDLEIAMPFERHYRELVAHVFTIAEQEQIHAAPAAQRAQVFLEYWTAKEAFVKLSGDGLSIAPPTIEVQRHHARVSGAGRVGVITPLMLGEGVVATLVTPGTVQVRLQATCWSGEEGRLPGIRGSTAGHRCPPPVA